MRNHLKKSTVYTFLIIFLLESIGCGSISTDINKSEDYVNLSEEQTTLEPQVDPTDDNYRVMYEIFTGSFSDSNGDGVGDLQGVIQRLDYLNDGNIHSGESLGIQGIWLTPIFESPSYHKYDVADYYAIDSEFGTEEDLKELITKCHERNMIVILDLVINHTSTKNAWFTKFQMAHQNASTSDPYYDFYTWCTAEERVGTKTYSQIPGCTGEYYECNFSTQMPELNYDNELVKQEVLKVAKYYLDLGVDGFRFDAVKYIYYGDNPKSIEFWNWYGSELKAYKEDIYMVGECWEGDSVTLDYISAINCFNFQMGQPEGKIADAVKGNIGTFTKYIETYQKQMLEKNPDAMMMGFISNHDMDRAAGYMTMLGNKAQMAANLYILCSGSPFLYYGEEIGMKGTRGGESTDANRRLAMLWGDGDTVQNPLGATFDESKQKNGTVASQLEDENSLYHYYAKVIAIRNRHPEIARGTYTAVNISKTVAGFVVEYEGSKLAIIHNVDTEPKTIDLSQIPELSEEYETLADFIGMGSASLEGSILTIEAQTSVVLE